MVIFNSYVKLPEAFVCNNLKAWVVSRKASGFLMISHPCSAEVWRWPGRNGKENTLNQSLEWMRERSWPLWSPLATEWMWPSLHRSKMGRPWTRPRTLQRIHDRSDMFSSCFFSSITVEATVYRACFCLMLACRILGRSIHETLILTSAQARISKTSVWLPQFLGIEPWSASSRSFAATKTDVLLCRKATHHWGI